MPEWVQAPPLVKRALTQEAWLAKSLLESGATALRNADYGNPSRYYEAFFNLTIGMERVAKLILAVDHRLRTGAFPTEKYFRNQSHKLVPLFAALQEVSDRHGFGFVAPMGAAAEALAFLDEFATADRYYNLNSLTRHRSSSDRVDDPLSRWYDLVFTALTDREKVLTTAEKQSVAMFQSLDSLPAVIWHFETEKGDKIDGLMADHVQWLSTKRVQIRGTMLCLNLLRYQAGIMHKLDSVVNAAGIELPWFGEFFVRWRRVEDARLRQKHQFIR